jgi:hypothetical protein
VKDVEILTSHLGAGILIGVIYVGWLLRNFSRRMSEVVKMRPYYRAFDLGNLLILVATMSYILQCSAALPQHPQSVLTTQFSITSFYLPLGVGIAVDIAATLVYWGWLLKQR